MNLSQFISILAARYKIVLSVFIITVLTTLAVSLWLPKTYKATTTVLLATNKGIDPVTGHTMPVQLMPGFMATQLDVISSTRTALMIVDQLKMAQSPVIQKQFKESEEKGDIRHWLAALLLKKLDVEPSRESNLITISFKGENPEFAATIANAFANAYQEMSIKLTVEPSKQAAAYLTNQINVLRDQLDTAQKKVSRFQQEEGIIDVDNRLDVETRRLNELSSQLTLAQGEIMGSGKGDNTTRDGGHSVVKNTLINGLKVNLVQAQAELADARQKLGVNHPNYEGIKAQVSKLQMELAKHTQSTSRKAINREAEIRAALEAQKTRVLALTQARDELKLLLREAEGAQHAYDNTMQHLNRTNLEGRSNLSSVSRLDPAIPPVKHDSPNLLLNMILSIFLGGLLAIITGLLIEMFDRRIRSKDDLTKLLSAPVLGEMDWRKSKPFYTKLAFMRASHHTHSS